MLITRAPCGVHCPQSDAVGCRLPFPQSRENWQVVNSGSRSWISSANYNRRANLFIMGFQDGMFALYKAEGSAVCHTRHRLQRVGGFLPGSDEEVASAILLWQGGGGSHPKNRIKGGVLS